MEPVRRVVTGHDADGVAIVVSDGAPPRVMRRQSGLTSTLVWVTDETPADMAVDGDLGDRDIGTAPPSGGAICRVVDFPPEEADAAAALDPAAVLAEMGISHGQGGVARHPAMHRTRSIDYAIVLSGEIDMLLDDSEVHLKAGDILVQQATNHAWVNRGTETCRIAFVLIDGTEPPGWGGAK